MELTGRVIAILPLQSGTSQRTGNAWASQEYVIEVPGQYPKKCVFKVFGQDRINQFNIQMNEDITVQFDIDAHEWNGRWFPEIKAFNVLRGQQGAQQPAQSAAQQPAQAQQQPNLFPQDNAPAEEQQNNDDLPF